MKQVRYNGQEDRVLIDVGALSAGDIVSVRDEFADSLVASFPDAYEIVEETSTNAPADPQPQAEEDAPATQESAPDVADDKSAPTQPKSSKS